MRGIRVATSCLFVFALVSLFAGCGGGGNLPVMCYDNEVLVYMAEPVDGAGYEVWMMAPDGSGKQMLADHGDDDAIQGSLSPNGRNLLYLTNDTGTKMLVKNLKTGVLTTLVEDATDSNNDMTPAYSPDGSQIARSDSRDRAIHLMNADGTGDVLLTAGNPIRDLAPAWNRAGSKIAFDRGWNGSIYTMNPDGSDQTEVKAQTAQYRYGTPQFLPDGRIVCMRYDDTDAQRDVVIMNGDGSGEVNLTPNTDTSDDFAPTVSADGKTIAFATDRNGEKDIYVGKLSGTTVTNLKNITADADYDCWRPRFGKIDRAYTGL